MKSLNDKLVLSNPEIFTKEIMDFIISERFEYTSNDSRCNERFPEHLQPKRKHDWKDVMTGNYNNEVENLNWRDNCYYKYAGSYNGKSIKVFIFETGIGVDIEYILNSFDSFETYSFEECYDKMVDLVNKYRNS